jgi:hypothetical protein
MISEKSSEKYNIIFENVYLTEEFDSVKDNRTDIGKLEYCGFKLRFISQNKELNIERIKSLTWQRKHFRVKPSKKTILVYLFVFILLVFYFAYTSKLDSWYDWPIVILGSLFLVVICIVGDELIHIIMGKWIKVDYLGTDGKQESLYLNVPANIDIDINKLYKKLSLIQNGLSHIKV